MITKTKAAQIEALLCELVKLGGVNYVNAVRVAKRSLVEATEGRQLPQQLKLARQREQLPRCTHERPLMDWAGEQLVPPCGCRLVEPDVELATQPKTRKRRKEAA